MPKVEDEADVKDFSLGMPELATISSDRSWHSPGPDALRAVPFATVAWQKCGSDAQSLHRTWLTLLLAVGCAIVPKGSLDVYTVLHVCSWGCIAWRLHCVTNGKLRFFEFTPQGADEPWPWCIWSAQALDACKIFSLKAIPPIDHHGMNPSKQALGGIVLAMDGLGVSMAKFAAKRAFTPLTISQLTTLASMLGLAFPGKRPSLEREWVEALVKHELPDLDSAAVAETVASRDFRGSKKGDATESLPLDACNDAIAAEVCGEGDLEDVTAIKKHAPI